MMYDLPTSVEVCGMCYDIRSDYRVALDMCAALSDPGLTPNDKGLVLLEIFYPDFEEGKMPNEHFEEAIKKCLWFINCGAEDDRTRKSPKLMDWEQDFQYIVAPVNRVLGTEIRAAEYLHWWTFISAYYEIGECLFSQIIRIRNLRASGKPLDKMDREWYSKNRNLVDIRTSYTEQEDALLKQWTGGA